MHSYLLTLQQRFGVTSADPNFMLGVSRSITVGDDGVRVLEYTMPTYIENVYDEYKDYISDLKLRSTRILPLDEGFTYAKSRAGLTK